MTEPNRQQVQKQQVAQAALEFVRPDTVLGVGTGSTVICFIEALAASGIRLEAAVSSSDATSSPSASGSCAGLVSVSVVRSAAAALSLFSPSAQS